MTHFIVAVVVLWAALAIFDIGASTYMGSKVNDLAGEVSDLRKQLTKTTDSVEKARSMQQAQMNELVETRIEVRKQQHAILSMFDLFAEIEPTLVEVRKRMEQAENGEIDLPEMSEEFEEAFRKEMIDDKNMVCQKLAEFLQYTRAGEDIESIRYEKIEEPDGFSYEEYAVIKYRNGYANSVTITGDSGKAIAKDVIASI